jgi:branched-chain amino acid transport system permease protein
MTNASSPPLAGDTAVGVELDDIHAGARRAKMARRVLLLVCVLLVGLPFAVTALAGQRGVYWLYIGAQFFTLAMVAVSLDLLMGRTGQISLGHNGFFAIGAYTAAILSVRFNVDIVVAMAASGATSAIASLVLGFPAARLRGHYLGIVTFGFGIAINQIALKWDNLTGGDQGLHLKPPSALGLSLASPIAMYLLTFTVLAVAVFLVRNLTQTRIGRSFAAVRDSEIAAAAMGVPIARTKVIAFVCSAFLAGVAGCLYAFLAGFIAPEDFGVTQAMLFLAMVVIGGQASIAGAIGGALVVDVVQQAASTVSGLSLAILGGVIVLVTLFFPYGLKGLIRRFLTGGRRARTSKDLHERTSAPAASPHPRVTRLGERVESAEN